MKGLDVLFFILSALVGYLLGSFLPGYFLPLWIKRMDIREVGDGNPGVINVNRNAGFALAFFTCLYDVSKGLLSVFVILYLFKLPAGYAYLAGISAVLGHKFPFYLGFKGGRGIAATVGLFIFILIKILVNDFTYREIIPLFLYIMIFALLLLLATHGKGDLFTISIFPFIGIYFLLHLHLSIDLIFLLAMISIMAVEARRNLARDKVILSREKGLSWRGIARLLALLFIPLDLVLPHNSLLILIACFLVFSFLLDLFRMIIPKVEDFSQAEILRGFKLCKQEEQGKISCMTDFLLGIFLCFLLFDRNVAYSSLGFVSLAGFFKEVVELNFGRNRIFARSEKTLEGSLAFLSAAVTIAVFIWSVGLLPLHTVLVGAIAALITSTVPSRNAEVFTIPLISGVVMSLL